MRAAASDATICAWAAAFVASGDRWRPLMDFRAVLEEAAPQTDVFVTLYGAIDETMVLAHFLERYWTPHVGAHDTVSVQSIAASLLRRVPRMFDRPVLFQAIYGGEQVYYVVVNCNE